MRARRGPKESLDPWTPYAFLAEDEVGPTGERVATATVFLTNRECPFSCLMCDLWQKTLDERVPVGAIPAQIRHALSHLGPDARQIKLYNAGSFFDPQAIPPDDYPEIARAVAGFERVIVECHPAFLADPARCLRFRDLLAAGGGAHLEVAVGLETVHEAALAFLNKGMTRDEFARTAAFLRAAGISLRVFLLVRPPLLSEAEGVVWAKRSLDFAFDAGASVCALIPTRAGNGAMEQIGAAGRWNAPSLAAVEAAQRYGLSLRRGRVLSDLWDVERFYTCAVCSPERARALAAMNQSQRPTPPRVCDRCGPLPEWE